jgi:hypothetical protein
VALGDRLVDDALQVERLVGHDADGAGEHERVLPALGRALDAGELGRAPALGESVELRARAAAEVRPVGGPPRGVEAHAALDGVVGHQRARDRARALDGHRAPGDLGRDHPQALLVDAAVVAVGQPPERAADRDDGDDRLHPDRRGDGAGAHRRLAQPPMRASTARSCRATMRARSISARENACGRTR